MSSQILKTVCPHDCPSVCPLEVVKTSENRIAKVKGASDNPYTAGVVCGKVARYAERIHHPERLLYPLKRVGPKGSGQFERISWQEALDTVEQAFKKAEADYGAESIWPYQYGGTMGYVMRDGVNRLRHVKKYSNMQGTFCVALANPGWNAGVGAKYGPNALEMEKADVIVIWGTNAVSTQIHVMTHALKGVKNGAKLIVVDPYKNKTAEKADLHIPLRPGTDGAFAAAVMHVLFRENYADRAYMKQYTDHPEAFERHLDDKTPEWAEKITGVAAHTIETFARLYGSTKKSFIRVGYGMSRTRNGAVNMHAVSCLPSVTGAWKVEGGGALYGQSGLTRNFNMDLINGTPYLDPSVRTLDMSVIGDVLLGDAKALQNGPPVKAMLIQNTNPMAVAPETNKVKKGFLRDDLFLCVHEQFMTETAQMADIVLPATMFMEHDDIYSASGHARFQAARKIIDAPGECRSNHEVICELAKRLGASDRGFEMTAHEIMEETLSKNGLPSSGKILAQTGFDLDPGFEESHFLNGFPQGDGKFHFKVDWSKYGPHSQGMPEFPDHWQVTDEVSEEKPYRLVTAPAQNFLNSSFGETKSSRIKEKQPQALIHQKVLQKLGVQTGELVRIGNERGSVLLCAVGVEGQHPDTIVVEGIWPNSAFIEGVGINSLTSAKPGFPNNGAAFHDTSIWLRRHH